MVFVCHVTLQDHVIKGLNYFVVWSPSRYITILPSLVAIVIVLVCRVILQDHVIKGSCDFMSKSPSW